MTNDGWIPTGLFTTITLRWRDELNQNLEVHQAEENGKVDAGAYGAPLFQVSGYGQLLHVPDLAPGPRTQNERRNFREPPQFSVQLKHNPPPLRKAKKRCTYSCLPVDTSFLKTTHNIFCLRVGLASWQES